MRADVSSTAAKLGGGAFTYATSYTVAEKAVEKTTETSPMMFDTHQIAFDVAYASDIASFVAGVLTAIYFAIQSAYSLWKWYKEKE